MFIKKEVMISGYTSMPQVIGVIDWKASFAKLKTLIRKKLKWILYRK